MIGNDRAKELENWRKKCLEVENENAGNRSKLIEVENKVGMLLSENERLNSALKDLMEENEIWSNIFTENERNHLQHMEEL